MRPLKEDYLPYYGYYIDLVKENNIIDALIENKKKVLEFISSIPENKSDYMYAEGKWSVKQVLNHIIDTERIFGYRALRFSRGDTQVLPGFDENLFAANANLKNTDLKMLYKEFESVREANIILFKQLAMPELSKKGKTTSGEATVLSIGYMMCGHALHHVNVIKEKYL